jgi:hypothetical protein
MKSNTLALKILTTITIILLSLFTGCTSSSNKVKNEMPSWFLNTPSNNSNYLYGSGSGYSKEEAKNDALSHISSSLQVQIKSKITQKKETISQNNQALYYSSDTKKELEAKALKIDYQNVKISKIKQSGEKIYILAQIDKKALIKQKLYQLQEKDIFITKQIDLASKQNSKIATIQTYQKVTPDITQAKSLINILKILGYDFDKKCYTDNYTNYYLDFTKAMDSLKIAVNSDNQHFKNIISSHISENGYKINNNSPDIVIKNKNVITNSKYKGWFIAKVSSNIEVKCNSKIIKNHTINSVGRSSISKDLAIQSASKKFEKNLKKKSIEKFLF